MPKLMIKSGPGVGRDFMLGAGACVVGRDPGADFTLEDTVVSRRHFRVVQEQGLYWVEDLGSTNGTLVNGRRMERIQLVDGDIISVGSSQVSFVQKDLLAASGGAASASNAPVSNVPMSRRQRKRGGQAQRSVKPQKPSVAPDTAAPNPVAPQKPKPAKPARAAQPPAAPAPQPPAPESPPAKGGVQAPVPRRRRGR